MQDHLFISYATEDSVLAEWLTRKLTTLGYRVWCDRFELLGGERFPRDIDRAIKENTFRVIALLSKISIGKEGSTKERTLALNIAKERKVDFLIPLLLERLNPSELDWMMSDITNIPFHQSWATGLAKLVQKLDRIRAPKPLQDGRKIAAYSIVPEDVLEERQESLHSNILPIQKLPDVIKRFILQRRPTPADEDAILQTWPAYRIDEATRLAFSSPPPALYDKFKLQSAGAALWQSVSEIDNVRTSNIVSNLIKQSIDMICRQRGLKKNVETGLLYFPVGLLPKNKLPFTTIQGRKSYVLAVGQRTMGGSKYRYHLAPVFHVRRDLVDGHCVLLRLRLFMTNENGMVLPSRRALSRRKHLCKNWWNDEWFKRHLAVLQFLANGGDTIALGAGAEEVRFSSKLESIEVDFGINEEKLAKKRTKEEEAFIYVKDDDEDDGNAVPLAGHDENEKADE
jgi:TIR domain